MRTSPFGFGVHWFNLAVNVTEDDLLKQLPILQAQGVSLLDLPAGMIDPKLAPERLGQILSEHEMEAAFCVFHVGYDCLDNGAGKKIALAAIHQAAATSARVFSDSPYGDKFSLRPMLTGPLIGSIGVDYGFSGEKVMEVVNFMGHALEILHDNQVIANVELIRPSENRLFAGLLRLLEIIKIIDSPLFLLHADTFHMQLWGELTEKIFSEIGPHVGHFHASGRLRQTPGHGLDNINWRQVSEWAKKYFTHPRLKHITLEGFCPEFRKAVVEIGGEFPADLEAMPGIVRAQRTLSEAGSFA